MTKTPPIDWPDLLRLGMDPAAIVSTDGKAITVTPTPPKPVADLLAAAQSSPPPYGDRMAYMRHIRDLLLDCTDWTQVNDSPGSAATKQQWAQFRQKLRDLPATYSGSGPIPWPAIPTA